MTKLVTEAVGVALVLCLCEISTMVTASRELELSRAEVERGDNYTLYTLTFTSIAIPTIFWRNGAEVILPGGEDEINISHGDGHGDTTLRTRGQDEAISVHLDVQSMYYDVHFRQQPGRSSVDDVEVPTSGITFSQASNVTFRHGHVIISTLSVPLQRTNYKINGVHWHFITVDNYTNPTGVVEYSDQADGQSTDAPVQELERLYNQTSIGARMQVATDRRDYEGILTVLVAVESTDDNSPVYAVKEGHKFYIRRDDHLSPFPDGFIGFISNGLTRDRVCRSGSPCNVPCLAVGVGLTSMKLFTREGGVLEEVDVEPYNMNMSYMLFSEFRVPGSAVPGQKQYVCQATSNTITADKVISISFD